MTNHFRSKGTALILSIFVAFFQVLPSAVAAEGLELVNGNIQSSVPFTPADTQIKDQIISSQENVIITPNTVIDSNKNIIINTDKDVLITSGTILKTTKDLTINAGGEVIVAPDAQIKAGGDLTINANNVEGMSPLSYTTDSGSNSNTSSNTSSQLENIQMNATIGGVITITSVSALPHKPEVKLQTYSATGRSQFPGYGSFVPGADRNNFSYRYDVGAAPGATVDVVIAKDLISADLSGGPLKMRLKRINATVGFDGLDQISVIVIDALGNQFSQRVTLSNNFQDYEFDLAGQAGFAAAAVSKIILRQNYADIDLVNYQQERRGEIFVNTGNLDVPVKSPTLGFSRAGLTELPAGTRTNGRGFMNNSTVPGYITVFDENPSDEIRQFRYDVGGSDGSIAHAEILPPQGQTSFVLPQSFVMALKNDGNGAKVNVRFTDSNNREKEFLVTLTNQFQNINFNFETLTGGSGEFNYESVKKIAIEVTRKLSPERRGRIDFYLPLVQTDPFTEQKPVVNSATADAVGNSTIQFSTLTGAVIYQVQIARDANFNNIVHEGFPVNPPETVKINESGTFFVRVRGSKNVSVETGPVSQWSNNKQLVITRIVDAKPAISQITTSNLTGETKVDFTSVAGATIYHVQVATDSNFSNIVHNGFPTGLFETVNLGTNQTYFVRVKGSVDGNFVDGFTSLWSTTQQFTRNVPSREFNPDATLVHTNITSFPTGTAGALKVTSLGSGGNSSDSATATDRGVRINYNTGTAAGNSGGFAGGGFTYDDFGTPGTIESGNLSGLTELILGIQGDSTRLKFEIVDTLGHSSYVFLNNVASATEKFWRIPLSLFEGVDLTKVRIMYLIVEGHGKSGQLLINRLPDNVIPRDYNPDATLTNNNITLLPDGTAGAPKITSLGSGGNSSDSATVSDRGVLVTYNTGTAAGGAGGFAGGGFTFDDFGTGPFESGNISGLTHLVFGVKGNSADLKLELVDKNGNSNFVRLHQVSSTTEQFYKIPTAAFAGVDLTQLRIIYFIVEGHGKSGTLEINRLPSNPRLIDPDATLTENDLNQDQAPDYETFVTSLGSSGNSQDDVEFTDRGLLATYNTGTAAGGSGGFAGAGFTFDDFGTGPIETADLTLLDEFIIGVKGTESQLKLEVVDGAGHSSFVHIRNISPTQEKFYRIPTALFESQIDITQVRIIYFIAEGHGKSGTFEVNLLPTPPIVMPSATLTTADIVDFMNGGINSGAVTTFTVADPALGASALVSSNGRGVDIQFNTGNDGFAGAGFSYDNFGTPATESTNLTGVTLKVGFKGPALRVRMIVEDITGRPDMIYLDGIVSATEKVFEIPMSLFDEIDLTKVKNIFLLYEGDGITGTLSFYNKKPA